jgi:hypothetical protein
MRKVTYRRDQNMGRSSKDATVEEARWHIKDRGLERTSWSYGLRKGRKPTRAEIFDDDSVVLWYGSKWAEYSKEMGS